MRRLRSSKRKGSTRAGRGTSATIGRRSIAGLALGPVAACRASGERLWTLNAVRVPDGVDEAAVRKHLLDEFNIEIGAGLGPLAGKIWRVGLMGASSRRPIVLFLGAWIRRWRRSNPCSGVSAGLKPRPLSASSTIAGRRDAGLAEIVRAIGRWLIGSVAVVFAYLVYSYLTLPDVRPLRTTNPGDDRVHRAARRRSAQPGRQPRRVAAVGRATGASRRISSAPCWSPKTTRSGSTKASTSINCRSRWSRTGREDDSRAAGSTITQQLAKNLYLSPSKNPLRKLRELHHRPASRGRAEEGADPRAVSERDRVGRRHLRRRGGRPHVLSNECGLAGSAEGGATGRRDHQSAGC